jgi:hypothetical protein
MTTPPPAALLVRSALWGLIVTACALQAYQISNRGIDPDELEHLHAAFCVWHGEVPYRDFFEHHAPGLYYLVWPAFEWHGPNLNVLWSARAMMFGCSLAAIWLTGRLAGRWGDERCRLIAMVLLAWTTIFQAKGIELRPDVPAMLLLLLAVVPFTYASGGGSWRRFLSVGFLCGLALLFTQKSVVPTAGMGAAACLSRLLTRAPDAESVVTILARVAVPILAGAVAVWGIASLLLASVGAAGDFWYSTWYQLWIWPIRSNRWDHLRPTLAGDLTVWIAAIIEIGAIVRRWRLPETWAHQRGAAAVIAATCILSLPFVKATYPQFYLLWMPFLAALAASRIVSIFDGLALRDKAIPAVVAGAGLAAMQFVFWQRAESAGFAGALPRLSAVSSANALVLVALVLTMCAIVVTAWRRWWGALAMLFSGLGMMYGILRDIDIALWSNREQVAAIDEVNRQVPVEGRVLDGFTGFAALRPHAWYYWWINEYSLALVPERERAAGLLGRLERDPPAAILFDRHVELLPPDVVAWIREHYESAEPRPLWLRKPAGDE